jgi:hypothetical protein
MSQRFLRHSWLAISAPFFALAIGRFADGNWKSATLLACIGIALVGIEVFVVLRMRLRNPFYRLRNYKTDSPVLADELRRFQGEVSGYSAQIAQEATEYAHLIMGDELQVVHEPASRASIGERRRRRQRLRSAEKELCDLLSEFRGFFYIPD